MEITSSLRDAAPTPTDRRPPLGDLPWCTWSTPGTKFLLPYETNDGTRAGHFLEETYNVLRFLVEEMYVRRGVMWMPVTGTALGAYRHGGGFRDDDDVDVIIYVSKDMKSWEDVTTSFTEGLASYRSRHPEFNWFVFSRPELPEPHPCLFHDFDECVGTDMKKRWIFAELRSGNVKSVKTMFWGKRLPNHMGLYVLPHSFSQNTNGGPYMLTVKRKIPIGNFCACHF